MINNINQMNITMLIHRHAIQLMLKDQIQQEKRKLVYALKYLKLGGDTLKNCIKNDYFDFFLL